MSKSASPLSQSAHSTEVATAELLGHSLSIERLRRQISQLASAELTVLVLGEAGTGKEIVARRLHQLSARRSAPFVAVNCGALAPTLLESELFGHERGAFTGASTVRQGKFEAAHGGTLMLDEIAELSLDGQAALLRVLEERRVTRVGGNSSLGIDTRIIAATNRDLANEVRQGRFREDLYYRLAGVLLELPPLRQRGDDIVLLAASFLEQFSRAAGRKTPRLSASAIEVLFEHDWPGNVRELKGVMERAVHLTNTECLSATDLSFIPSTRPQPAVEDDLSLSLAEATRRYQTDLIRRQVQACQGNMTAAARQLGLTRANLYRKLAQLRSNVDHQPAESPFRIA